MEHLQNAETQKHYEKTYHFDVDVAQKYGVDEAIILYNFRHWIKVNRADGKNFHEGHTWTYKSIKALAEIWPFWSTDHIRRKLNRLVEVGVLVKDNYNRSGYDRTLWYAFKNEKTWFKSRAPILQKRKMDLLQPPNPCGKTTEPIPNQSTNESTDENQKQKDVGNSLSEKKSLGLVLTEDKAIAEGRNRLAENIARLLPPVTGREKTTFRHILDYLVHGCQIGRFGVEIFDQAAVWVQEAKADGIKPKKLFVYFVKTHTGFATKQKNPPRTELKKTCDGGGN